MPPVPPMTQFLILACTSIFCLQFFLPIAGQLALFPVLNTNFRPWQLLTYAVTHSDFITLLFGMLGLWMFGGELELSWGKKRYAAFLAIGAAFGALVFIVLSLLAPGILMGSFAASYALLIAAAMTYPNRTVVPLIPPIPMKMKTLVIVFGCLALFLAVLSSNIASLAHLGGMIGGYLTLRYWRGLSPFSQRRR